MCKVALIGLIIVCALLGRGAEVPPELVKLREIRQTGGPHPVYREWKYIAEEPSSFMASTNLIDWWVVEVVPAGTSTVVVIEEDRMFFKLEVGD